MRRSKERRGVLLLVCLVILVLFLLLGVTFVLIASNWRVSSTAHIRAHEYTGPSNLIADDVLMRFLRGTSDPRSPFFVHNLLGDRYGEPSLRGVVDGTNAPAPIAGGQFVRFDIVADGGFSLSSIDHYYDGLEITMLTGTAKGKTSRVVNYDATNATIDVLAFDALPAGGDRFLVNGRSFSGTGGGFNPATGMLQTSPQYAALQGNAMYHNDSDANYPVPGGRGGNNESYDAPTYNRRPDQRPYQTVLARSPSRRLCGYQHRSPVFRKLSKDVLPTVGIQYWGSLGGSPEFYWWS